MYKNEVMLLNIVSVNVRGFQGANKRKSVFGCLKSIETDIFCLQECGIPYSDYYYKLKQEWNVGESVWSGSNRERTAGLGFLFKNPNIMVVEIQEVFPGRLLVVDIKYRDTDLRLVNVYGSQSRVERVKLFEQLRVFLVTNKILLVAGDFNCGLLIEDQKKEKNRCIW